VTEATRRSGPVIGIDVGGTFTDFVAADPNGVLTFHKEPSTPDDPSLAVERGLAALRDSGVAADLGTALIVHGTTLALNAVLQRRGARIALIVSRGNRDVLEIARCRMPSSFNFLLGKQEPLVPRDIVFEVDARMAADGTLLRRPSAAEFDRLCDCLAAIAPEVCCGVRPAVRLPRSHCAGGGRHHAAQCPR
jgi:N-methylhydantoinase A